MNCNLSLAFIYIRSAHRLLRLSYRGPIERIVSTARLLLVLISLLLSLLNCRELRADSIPAVKILQAPANVEVLQAIPYGKGGDQDLLLDMAWPKSPSPVLYPAVVFIHGGSWSAADRSNGWPLIKLLAQKGFVAASIDYRLSSQAGFPAQLEDCKCAVRFLRAHADEYHIDPDRIGVSGGSAGGHLAALVGLSADNPALEGSGGWQGVSSRVESVADLYGASDLGELFRENKLKGAILKLMRGTPEMEPELYRQASPLAWVKTGAPPFYLAHGDKDTTIPPSQSQELYNALQAVGTEAQLRVMVGLGHGSIASLPPYVLTDVVAFFQQSLKPVGPSSR